MAKQTDIMGGPGRKSDVLEGGQEPAGANPDVMRGPPDTSHAAPTDVLAGGQEPAGREPDVIGRGREPSGAAPDVMDDPDR